MKTELYSDVNYLYVYLYMCKIYNSIFAEKRRRFAQLEMEESGTQVLTIIVYAIERGGIGLERETVGWGQRVGPTDKTRGE